MRARPPILFTLCYAAGLATGLLRFIDPGIVTGIAIAAVLVARRPLASLLATALVIGSLSGSLAMLEERGACRVKLPAAKLELTARLLEPADRAGGRIELRPIRAGCQGSIPARWPRDRELPIGTEARIRGEWVPRAGLTGRASGILLVSEFSRLSTQASTSESIRGSLRHASLVLYGSRAPLVDALILGTRGGIDRTLQDRFAQSGLVHLLSISGFHVGVITAWIFLLCRALGLQRSRAMGLSALVAVAYVGFLGWPAPASRAAALAVLLAVSRARQRRVEANALLAGTSLCVLLLDPWSILDLGGWLSVAALWGATTFTRWTDRTLGSSFWWRTVGSSVGATLATAPITAAALGTVAVVGIGLNLVAIPLAAVTVPGVFASLLLFPLWQFAGAALAAGAGLGLHGLELLAAAGAAVPGGHIITSAEPRSAVPWALTLSVSLWAVARHTTAAEAIRRWSLAGVAVAWGGLLWQAVPAAFTHAGSGLALHFLDVGQGDGAVLRTPAGHWILIDAGPRTDRSDAGRRVVVPFLLRQGAGELSVVFVSHAHADHLGGVASVLERFGARAVIEPGEQVADPLYYGFLDELIREEIPWHPGRTGDRFVLDSVRFTILHPDPHWTGWGEDINEDSLVLLVEYGAFQALFAGDAGFPAERELRSRTRRVDLLKVGHHGSRGSTGNEWLDSLRPSVAIVSVGQNTYGHPSRETLQRLMQHRVALWRTDRDGLVSVTTDGRQMTVRSRHRSETYDVNDDNVNSPFTVHR